MTKHNMKYIRTDILNEHEVVTEKCEWCNLLVQTKKPKLKVDFLRTASPEYVPGTPIIGHASSWKQGNYNNTTHLIDKDCPKAPVLSKSRPPHDGHWEMQDYFDERAHNFWVSDEELMRQQEEDEKMKGWL